MRYFIRCGCLLVFAAAGCSGSMRGHADTSAPPASGVDLPTGGSNKASKAVADKGAPSANADGPEKSPKPEATKDKK